jgi:hypothetical protein
MRAPFVWRAHLPTASLSRISHLPSPQQGKMLTFSNQRIFVFGYFLSAATAQMSFVTIALQSYSISQETALVGIVSVSALPALLIMGYLGGKAADRWSRRLLLLL